MKDTTIFNETNYSAPSLEIVSCATECGFEASSTPDDGWDTFLDEYIGWGDACGQFE